MVNKRKLSFIITSSPGLPTPAGWTTVDPQGGTWLPTVCDRGGSGAGEGPGSPGDLGGLKKIKQVGESSGLVWWSWGPPSLPPKVVPARMVPATEQAALAQHSMRTSRSRGRPAAPLPSRKLSGQWLGGWETARPRYLATAAAGRGASRGRVTLGLERRRDRGRGWAGAGGAWAGGRGLGEAGQKRRGRGAGTCPACEFPTWFPRRLQCLF